MPECQAYECTNRLDAMAKRFFVISGEKRTHVLKVATVQNMRSLTSTNCSIPEKESFKINQNILTQ